MPIPKEDGLLDNVDYFLMKSLGCIGLLKEWLERALKDALKQETPIISREALERAALPNKRLIKILQEIKLGETMLADVKDQELAKELGLEITPCLAMNLPKNSGNLPQTARDGIVKTGRKQRVGRRNPSRDPVGGIENAA